MHCCVCVVVSGVVFYGVRVVVFTVVRDVVGYDVCYVACYSVYVVV